MSEQGSVEDNGESTRPEVSSMLVRARETLGLSQADVAGQLYLTTSFIQYIDEGAFEKIPKAAFIKGYLRSYARVVNLVGDDVVKCYEPHEAVRGESREILHVTVARVGPASFTGPVATTGAVGLLIIVVLFLLVWWLTRDEESAPLAIRTPVAEATPFAQNAEPVESMNDADRLTENAANQLPEQAMMLEPDNADSTDPDPFAFASGTPPDSDQATDEAEGFKVNLLPIEPPSRVSIERRIEAGHRFIRLAAGGEDHIEFNFNGECWLEIADATGQSIYGDLNQKGDVINVFGMAPFRVLVGRAQSVTIRYNDRDVNLVPHILNDTAKLVLGRN